MVLFKCFTCNQDVLSRDPRMLNCGHLICLQCIPNETFGEIIVCSKCYGDTMVPPNGFRHLAQGPVLKQLTDLLRNAQQPCFVCGNPASYKCTRNCHRTLCGFCLRRSATIDCDHIPAEPITMHCYTHKNFLISEYCDKCTRLLCTRCITQDTCSNTKINVKDRSRKQHCQTQVPREELLAKKVKFEQLRQQLSDIEQQVIQNTSELIKMTLETERVILTQLKQTKSTICEQLKSTKILLDDNLKFPHHHPITSNGPAITLLMEKLQLQMLEACINIPTGKVVLNKGTIKPPKLTIYHENTLYDPASIIKRSLENLDSWDINDVYEHVSTYGIRITPPRATDMSKWEELIRIKNELYKKGDNSCDCDTRCASPWKIELENPTCRSSDEDVSASRAKVKQQNHKGLTWCQNDNYIKVDKSYNGEKALAKVLHDSGQKLKPPQVPPKPKQKTWKLELENPSCLNNGDRDSSPRLDANFVEFTERAEDYNDMEDYITENYEVIDWKYPAHDLMNWTKETSRIIVTPDGKTILSHHVGSSLTQICTFNVSGLLKRECKVNYLVLDMAYSPVHKCAVLMTKKTLQYLDLDSMKEKWRPFELPKAADKEDYNQLSCSMLGVGLPLVLYETKGKLKLWIGEVTSTGSVENTACSQINSRSQHLKSHQMLAVRTDSESNYYLINKKERKIVIINDKGKFQPVLQIPAGPTEPPPASPGPGIFLTLDGKVGYVESKADGTFAFYWMQNIKTRGVVHVSDNLEHVLFVGHSGHLIYKKDELFAQRAPIGSPYPVRSNISVTMF